MHSQHDEVQKILTANGRKQPEPDPDWPHEVRKVAQCIHEHAFEEYLTAGWLKEHCSITNKNFSGKFKFYTGKGIKQYIQELRLEAAQELLAHDRAHTLSMLEIGLEVGFPSYAAFHRAFKKRFGLTPAQWVKQNEEKVKRK